MSRRRSNGRLASKSGPRSGFTLIEVVFALAILSFVLLATVLTLAARKEGDRRAEQQMRIWQVIENEAEMRRFTPYASLKHGAELPFESDLAILEGLEAEARVRVEETVPNLKVVTIEVVYGGRRASLDVYRAQTGRGSLF